MKVILNVLAKDGAKYIWVEGIRAREEDIRRERIVLWRMGVLCRRWRSASMSELSSFSGMAAGVVNVNLVKRDTYKRYKRVLDSLYTLGELQLERAAKP